MRSSGIVPGRVAAWLRLCLLGPLLTLGTARAGDVVDGNKAGPAPRGGLITLEACIDMALRRNRDLQIERLSPLVARAQLSGAQGFYDPVLVTDFRRDDATDAGGLDPADFSRDAVYSAESAAWRSGITGFLPSGMSYAITGVYAHSDGERNLLNFDSYNLGAGITARQPLLKNFWIDSGRLVIRVNRKLLESRELGVSFLVMDVVNRVQQAYRELQYAREYRQVQTELRAARQRTLAGLERQVELGLLTPANTLSTRAQLAALDSTLVAADNAAVLAENALRTLLGLDFRHAPEDRLLPAERLWLLAEDFDLDQCRSRGLAQRPDLAQLRIEVERGEIDLRFRRNQLFPSVDLVAGYGRRGASTDQLPPPLDPQASGGDAFQQLADGTNPSLMVGVIFSMPLSRASERANYRASRHLKAQAELRVIQKEELVLREITDAVLTAQLSLELARAAERAAALAVQALAAEERKLAGGTSTIYTVLLLQNDLLAARAAELRSRADHLKAVSQLQFADGTLLERRHIRIAAE
ncbi:MAG: TolC family protein [Limisphaerales bacterium]